MKNGGWIIWIVGVLFLLWAVRMLFASNALGAAQSPLTGGDWLDLGEQLTNNDTSILNGDNSLIPSVPLENYLPELDPTYS